MSEIPSNRYFFFFNVFQRDLHEGRRAAFRERVLTEIRRSTVTNVQFPLVGSEPLSCNFKGL